MNNYVVKLRSTELMGIKIINYSSMSLVSAISELETTYPTHKVVHICLNHVETLTHKYRVEYEVSLTPDQDIAAINQSLINAYGAKIISTSKPY